MALSDVMERFVRTPTRVKVIALLAISAFIGAIFYFVFYSDLADKAKIMAAQVTQLKAEKAKYLDRKQRYRAFRAEVNKLLDEQKELLKVLPDDANISTFLQSIHAQAAAAGVNILTYDQRPEVRQSFYAQIPVRMTISGSFHQISKFFYYMEKDLKRIVKIQDLLLTSPTQTEQGVVLRAQFVISTFRFVGKRPV